MKSLKLASTMGAARSGGASFASTIAAGVIIALLAGCGGGGGGGGGGGAQQVTAVTLSGSLTNGSGTPMANKLISVQGSSPLNSATTDSNGNYTLTVAPNQTITLIVQDPATAYPQSGCTQTQMPTYTTDTVTVGGNATQTANIAVSPTAAPPPPPLCS